MHSCLQAAASSDDDSSEEDDSSSEEEEEKKPAAKKAAAKPAAKVRLYRQLLHMPASTSLLLYTSTGRRPDSPSYLHHLATAYGSLGCCLHASPLSTPMSQPIMSCRMNCNTTQGPVWCVV